MSKADTTTYHLIPTNQPYAHIRRARCEMTGRAHRHQFHDEEYSVAACGGEVTRQWHDYCNAGADFVDPVKNPDGNGGRPWCMKCISNLAWTSRPADYIDQLRELGLFAD